MAITWAPRRRSSRFGTTAAWVTVVAAAWLGPAVACWGQEGPSEGAGVEAYCHLNKVEAQQLSNAVRLNLRADGVLRAEGDWSDFAEEVEPQHWHPRQTKRLRFRLPNARSEVGAFVNIGLYPVSHLEIGIIPQAIGGVGLDVTLVLFRRGQPRHIHLDNLRMSWGEFGEGNSQVEIVSGQDRRSVVILVTSDRYVDPRAKSHKERDAASLPRELAVQLAAPPTGTQECLLSTHALNIRLDELLDALAAKAGCTIITNSLRPHLVSLHLEGLPLRAILDNLARAYGLTVTQVQGQGPQRYAVSEGLPTAAGPYSQGEVRVLPVRNLPADLAGELLPNFLESYVHADAERNALVVGGPPQMLDKIAADLARIDQAPPQIEVESILVEAASMGELAAALDLHFLDGTSEASAHALGGDLTYRVVRGPDDLDVRLSALEARSVARTVARPRMTVANGEQGELFVGEERRFPFLRSRGRGQEITVVAVDVGTRLLVQPWTGGAEITVRLRTRSNTVLHVDESGLPKVSAREANGVLRLGRDELVLVGGLELVQSERANRKLPLLGDLPVVGAAFRSKATESQTTELALFVRARVVGTAASAASAQQPGPQAAAPAGRSESPTAEAAASAAAAVAARERGTAS